MPEVGPDIGATLRETRMRARIDIGEVEMRTKIRAKYLRAIENEEWDLLPGPVYVKSFLRTYGDYLGLDSRLLVDEYKRRYEFAPDAQHRPLSSVKRERERERDRANRGRRAAIPSWAIIALVLVAAGVALYLIGRGNNAPTPKAASGTLTHASTHTAAAATRTVARTTTTQPAHSARLATLKLVPTGSIWICAEYKNGRRLINGVTASAGQSLPALSGSELLVTLGNANVTVTADGKPYQLSPSATAIGLKVTPTGVSALPQGPTCA